MRLISQFTCLLWTVLPVSQLFWSVFVEMFFYLQNTLKLASENIFFVHLSVN